MEESSVKYVLCLAQTLRAELCHLGTMYVDGGMEMENHLEARLRVIQTAR